jgi:hypothetical protein
VINIRTSTRLYRGIYVMIKETPKTAVKTKAIVSIAAKNYRNSPLIRDFYRFVAKNGLREEAFRSLQNISNDNKKKLSYLHSITV